MKNRIRGWRRLLVMLLILAGSAQAQARSLNVTFSLPEAQGDKYAKPYVAVWAEQGGASKHLLVWHLQQKKPDEWLLELRRWWRKIGRSDSYADGLTGATRGPGEYQQTLNIGDWQQFTLYLEVVRQYGGRSLLKIPIDLGAGPDGFSHAGDVEIGPVQVTFTD